MNTKEYQREYHKKWYADPKNARNKKENAKKHRILKRARNHQFLKEYKEEKCCEKCDESHPACLDFHHLEPSEKDHNISDMVPRGYSIERINEEIGKCILVCRNCHAKIHWGD